MGEWYATQRKYVWSDFLATGMANLRRSMAPENEETIEEELWKGWLSNGQEQKEEAIEA